MYEGPLVSSGEIKIPGAKFLHPCSGSMWPGESNPWKRPEDIKKVSGMAGISFRSVGGKAHTGEESCPLRLVVEMEENCGHTAFPIVFVGLIPRLVIPIGNCTFAYVKSQKLCASFDRDFHLGVGYAGLLG